MGLGPGTENKRASEWQAPGGNPEEFYSRNCVKQTYL
jgi:hypothetical protein